MFVSTLLSKDWWSTLCSKLDNLQKNLGDQFILCIIGSPRVLVILLVDSALIIISIYSTPIFGCQDCCYYNKISSRRMRINLLSFISLISWPFFWFLCSLMHFAIFLKNHISSQFVKFFFFWLFMLLQVNMPIEKKPQNVQYVLILVLYTRRKPNKVIFVSFSVTTKN